MSTRLRTHGKSVVVWILMAVMIVGLGGFGVTSFTGNMGTIGSVGETEISAQDYARGLQNQMSQAQSQIGRPLTMQEAQTFGLPQQVQAQLFADAALSESARRLGLSVGDEEVARQITTVTAFNSLAGGFDRDTYRMVLRQQGYTESEFEERVRDDVARSLFRGVIAGGITAPQSEVDVYVNFITSQRPFAYAEVSTADLTTQPAAPTDEQLQKWYDDHSANYMAPETREFSYVSLTPDMITDQARPDEATLRAAYDAQKSQYQQPEHRLVDKLVFSTDEEAAQAKADLDAKKVTFADLARARGLDITDIDLGEVTKEDLGAVGDAVFGIDEPGVVGPITTALGPTLFSVNGIISAQTTSFEDALPDLEAAAILENSRRIIQSMNTDLEDRLASGATLEDLAKETKLELGHISMTANTQDGIAAYQAFRDTAAKASTDDFPALVSLDDGGVFALRLDKVVPKTVRPLADIKDQVVVDWTINEQIRLKTARADEIVAAVNGGATLSSQGLLIENIAPTERSAYIENVPEALVSGAFDIEADKAGVVTTPNAVYVVVPGQTQAADPNDPDVKDVRTRVADQLSRTLAADIGAYYSTAVEAEAGVTLDTATLNAVQTQMR